MERPAVRRGDGSAYFAKSHNLFLATDTLDYSSQVIGEKGVTEHIFSQTDEALCAIHHLSLRSNMLGDEGAAALANGLPRLKSLVSLDISFNSITDKGI